LEWPSVVKAEQGTNGYYQYQPDSPLGGSSITILAVFSAIPAGQKASDLQVWFRNANGGVKLGKRGYAWHICIQSDIEVKVPENLPSGVA